MKNLLLSPWFIVIICALLTTLTDTLGTLWWEKKQTIVLLVTLLLAPIAFLSFGYVGCHFGLARASSLTNSLIVVGPILVGVLFRQELQQLSLMQKIGVGLIVTGIAMLTLFRAPNISSDL
jgi:multidrug transporter EmrE-like cation transporter